MNTELLELDGLEVLAIIDNELDPISPCPSDQVLQGGGLREIAPKAPLSKTDPRGQGNMELRMDNICCSAHGLSLMITGIRNGERRTILFDAGPEETAWEKNVKRLRANIADIELIQLSHWHRDHSGGIPMAIRMINEARLASNDKRVGPLQVDLHPKRPDCRGVQAPDLPVVALEPDPTFEELEHAGAVVIKNDKPHAVLDGMFLVSGEIPRTTSYENGLRFGMRFDAASKTWSSDEKLADERLLMCKLKGKGIVVFTGCSHAGVVNVARHALELGGGTPIHAILGGYHLADAEAEKIEASVRDLVALKPNLMMPGHCTGWRAKFALHSAMPGRMAPCFVGSKYSF